MSLDKYDGINHVVFKSCKIVSVSRSIWHLLMFNVCSDRLNIFLSYSLPRTNTQLIYSNDNRFAKETPCIY